MAVLPAHGKLLIGTGEREFQFYELITFEFYCLVNGLEAVPLILDVCIMEDDKCLIVYGDDQVGNSLGFDFASEMYISYCKLCFTVGEKRRKVIESNGFNLHAARISGYKM